MANRCNFCKFASKKRQNTRNDRLLMSTKTKMCEKTTQRALGGARWLHLMVLMLVGMLVPQGAWALDEIALDGKTFYVLRNSSDWDTFFYTDGLYETENNFHEIFGMKRMMIRLKKSAENDESPKNIVERMTADVEKFRGNAKRIDDAVMVVIKAIG